MTQVLIKAFFKHLSFIRILGGIIIVVIILLLYLSRPFGTCNRYWRDSSFYIAHAGGEIDGYRYTNSKEAVLQALNQGCKYIELDIYCTSDSHLVCMHGLDLYNKQTESHYEIDNFTLDDFRKNKIYGRYTPISLQEVLLTQDSIDFVLVTDGLSDARLFNREINKNRNKIMVEAFSPEDFDNIYNSGYLPMLSIRSLNLRGLIKLSIYCMLTHHDVEWIVIHTDSWFPLVRGLKRLFGIKVAMYTSNSIPFFMEHLGKEVDLIYTDKIKQIFMKQ